MLKLPKGKSNDQELREKNYVYVDKTKFIANLENSNDSFVHFLRPGRFGKSLFTSMLGCYYDVALEDQFEQLFSNTFIFDHPTKERNSYYILNFNFAEFSGKHGDELEKEFHDKVYEDIISFINKYHMDIQICEQTSAARMLSRFLSEIPFRWKNHQIYVIIDNYDHFANKLLSFEFDEFSGVVSKDGYVRAFYEELKSGTQKGIGRIFVTGVSPITLDSMTSGHNISTNLSLDARYHDMIGFTNEEVKQMISS